MFWDEKHEVVFDKSSKKKKKQDSIVTIMNSKGTVETLI